MTVANVMKVVGVITTVGVVTTVGAASTVILTAYVTLKLKKVFDDSLENVLSDERITRKDRIPSNNRINFPASTLSTPSSSESKEDK